MISGRLSAMMNDEEPYLSGLDDNMMDRAPGWSSFFFTTLLARDEMKNQMDDKRGQH